MSRWAGGGAHSTDHSADSTLCYLCMYSTSVSRHHLCLQFALCGDSIPCGEAYSYVTVGTADIPATGREGESLLHLQDPMSIITCTDYHQVLRIQLQPGASSQPSCSGSASYRSAVDRWGSARRRAPAPPSMAHAFDRGASWSRLVRTIALEGAGWMQPGRSVVDANGITPEREQNSEERNRIIGS
jgi:hypothetical protein